jgi:hemoglobin
MNVLDMYFSALWRNTQAFSAIKYCFILAVLNMSLAMFAYEQTNVGATYRLIYLYVIIYSKGAFMKKFLIAILPILALILPLQSTAETEKSLYERLGGVFAIAAVVDHFSDAVVQNPIVGKTSKNPALRKWHTQNTGRLPGLKFMRTLWVCEVTGGPFKYSPTKPGRTHLGLEEAHRNLRISPAEFDEVAAELGRSLDFAKVPAREKGEVLAAFAAHKAEVTVGYKAK